MLVPKWREKGVDESEIVERLAKLGLDEQVYEHYVKLISHRGAA
jgi:hypothetical protein